MSIDAPVAVDILQTDPSVGQYSIEVDTIAASQVLAIRVCVILLSWGRGHLVYQWALPLMRVMPQVVHTPVSLRIGKTATITSTAQIIPSVELGRCKRSKYRCDSLVGGRWNPDSVTYRRIYRRCYGISITSSDAAFAACHGYTDGGSPACYNLTEARFQRMRVSNFGPVITNASTRSQAL